MNTRYRLNKKFIHEKITFFALSLLLLANTYSLARRMMKGELSSTTHRQEEKTKIKKEELPVAAKKTLEGDAFKGWTVVNSYKTKNGDYEVELKKAQNSQTIKFDKDGKVK